MILTLQVKLAQHTYSCLFGTFLCNNTQERDREKVWEQTFSVWSLLKKGQPKFTNFLYSESGSHVSIEQRKSDRDEHKNM